MVYRTNSPSADPAIVSLTRDRIDLPQRVTVNNRGFDIASELIFADMWQPRFGAPDNTEEVEAAIADIATMLRSASIKFSKIAADRVLSGEREHDLQKLIQINSVGDLTAVADILDPRVLKFLEKFADDQTGESGQ
jgi:hypothetical protein